MQPRGALVVALLVSEALSLWIKGPAEAGKVNFNIARDIEANSTAVVWKNTTHFTDFAGLPLDAQATERALSSMSKWKKYSQGNQDCIILNLFQALGTTNKYYVEFGMNSKGYGIPGDTGPNTELLHKQGWTGLLMDGGNENLAINLHKEFITPENIVSLFSKYNVPTEPDFVTIDIDSCDLFVFLGMIKEFRPRVVTIEYNANYPLDQSKVNRCTTVAGERYAWNGDNLYGASFRAIHKAAEQNGYTVVYVEKRLDVFLVRKDLVAPGTEVPLETFRDETGILMHRQAPDSERAKWIIDY